MDILLANPVAFCRCRPGHQYRRERAGEVPGAPIYVRHEVVHNRYVVNKLKEAGAVFVEELMRCRMTASSSSPTVSPRSCARWPKSRAPRQVSMPPVRW